MYNDECAESIYVKKKKLSVFVWIKFIGLVTLVVPSECPLTLILFPSTEKRHEGETRKEKEDQ